jgi:hypothetical protein
MCGRFAVRLFRDLCARRTCGRRCSRTKLTKSRVVTGCRGLLPGPLAGHPTFWSGHPTFWSGHPTFWSGHPTFRSGHPTFWSGHPTFWSGHPTLPLLGFRIRSARNRALCDPRLGARSAPRASQKDQEVLVPVYILAKAASHPVSGSQPVIETRRRP